MHKAYWRSFTANEGPDISRLQKFLEVGLQIESLEIEIGLRNMNLNWAQLKFSSALKSICVLAQITDWCYLFWDFVARHPSVESLNLKQHKLAGYVMERIHPEITLLLEEPTGPVLRVRSAVLAKTDNGWRFEDVHLKIIYTTQESHLTDCSGKLQRFGTHCPGLTNVTLNIITPQEMILLPGLSVDVGSLT